MQTRPLTLFGDYRRPYHPKLVRLLETAGDPSIGYFGLNTTRRMACNLYKSLFGPKGSRDVPKRAGIRAHIHPSGWTVRFHYDDPGTPNYGDQNRPSEPGHVMVEFIPPTTTRRLGQASTRANANGETREQAALS